MTTSKHDWTWVGTERVQAVHRLARWTQPAASSAAVLVVVACYAPAVVSRLGEWSSLVTTFAFMTVVCLVFGAVTARALPQVASAGSLDTGRARRFVTFSIVLCAVSWLFGFVLAGAASFLGAASPIPLIAGILGSILLTVTAVRMSRIVRLRTF